MSRMHEKRTLARYRTGARMLPGDHKRLKRCRRRMRRRHGLWGHVAVVEVSFERALARAVDAMRGFVAAFGIER